MEPQGWVELIGRTGVPIGMLAWILYYATKWGSELVRRHLALIDELVDSLREVKQLAAQIREREKV